MEHQHEMVFVKKERVVTEVDEHYEDTFACQCGRIDIIKTDLAGNAL